MRVLVTGASGLLGGAVARLLIDRGDTVTVMQRSAAALGCAEVRGDVSSLDDCEAAVTAAEPDAVVHLAARVSVVGEWDDFRTANVVGTQNLLGASRRVGAQRFVYVSSPSVAHEGSSLAGEGAGPASPDTVRGHYSRSKALGEQAALAAADDGFAVVSVRPHLVWGPGDTQLVGRIADRARSGRLAIVGSGAALIDTTYVDNAAEAIVAALDRAPEVSGRAFVVSNGEPRTVEEMLTRICRAVGAPPPTRHVPFRVAFAAGSAIERVWARSGRTDDPPMTSFLAEQLSTAHWFDQRETREALGWRPRVSLAEGFDRLAAASA
jgi:nucleoside-diphosphate-sugar epimerase